MRPLHLEQRLDGVLSSQVLVRGLTGAELLALRRPGSVVPASRARQLATTVSALPDGRALAWPDVERILIGCFAETFGPHPELLADCDTCGLTFELRLDLSALLNDVLPARGSVQMPSPYSQYRLSYRAPTAGE